MPAPPPALIAAWARSAIAPHGGAFSQLSAHEIASPVLHALLQQAGLPLAAVEAVVLGNALGAGGNPARVLALAAGLPDACAALSVDTQCCAGLDAVSLAVGLIASGQAEVVVAGGAEAWSRAPLRMHRPRQAHEPAVPYERPAFAPDPARDPDMLVSATRYAWQYGWTRAQQDAYATLSHQRALQCQTELAHEIVPVAGLTHDAYPRHLDPARVARMPAVVPRQTLWPEGHPLGAASESTPLAGGVRADCSPSAWGISAKADGAALVLLMSPTACQRWGIHPQAAWVAGASVGGDPATPLLSASQAAQAACQRAGITPAQLAAIELHDAFAVQGLVFGPALGWPAEHLNRRGGGLARGHPIGASGAIALVRVLADLAQDASPGALGLAAVAGAGGIGAAGVVRWG